MDFIFNEQAFQTSLHSWKDKPFDVIFRFKKNERRIYAHKEVLKAASSFFNEAFLDRWKEEKLIKLTGSQNSFERLIKIIYNNEASLSLDNIEDTMKCIRSYQVLFALETCVQFLRINLEVGDILWGLSLAFEYNLEELKSHCCHQITQNQRSVAGMFHWENGKPGLKDGLMEQGLHRKEDVYKTVFPLVTDYLTNPAMSTNPNINTEGILTLPLAVPFSDVTQPVENIHNFTITCDTTMRLTQLELSVLRDINGDIFDCEVEISIEKLESGNKNSESIYSGNFKVGGRENTIVKILNGIEILPSFSYRFYARMNESDLFADETIETNHSIVVEGINFDFMKNGEKGLIFKALLFGSQP